MGKWLKGLAEREGFEPPLPVRVNLISSPSPSLTQTNKPPTSPIIPSQFCPLGWLFLAIVGTSSRTILGQLSRRLDWQLALFRPLKGNSLNVTCS